MGKRHKILLIDEETSTGECAACGQVDLVTRDVRLKDGSKKLRWICAVARKEQRYPPGPRDRSNWQSSSGHGLTMGQAAEFRKGKSCEICGSTDRLAVDHCHKTGVIRGVLCFNHNAALGLFRDNVEHLNAAAQYLSRF